MTTTTDEIYYGIPTIPAAYEGASTSYRNELKGLINNPSDSIAANEVLLLQMRSAHAIRNNGYAKTAHSKYVTALGEVKVIWQNKNKEKHELMQELWDEFANNPNLDGHGKLGNTQSVWNSSRFMTGNSHTRLLIRRNENRVPIKLQTIPTQMHDINYFGYGTGKNVRYGMEFVDDKPANYYYREGLYAQYWYGQPNPYNVTEVPAKEIIHIFERQEPGQWIGIPQLASVLIPLYELDELIDATIAKQKAAQAIAWIIENTNPMNVLPIGGVVNTTDENNQKKIVFKAQGGNVQYLNKGETAKFYQSTDIGPNLQTLIRSELRKIAGAVDVPYHTLTNDTDGLDFSSIRAIGIELRNRLEYIHHFLNIPLGLDKLCQYFKAIAMLYFSGLDDATPTYQLPRWYGVDELKDTMADVLEVQNGMATLESKLAERHTTFEEILEDRKRIKTAGIDNLLTPSGATTGQANNNEANANSSSN